MTNLAKTGAVLTTSVILFGIIYSDALAGLPKIRGPVRVLSKTATSPHYSFFDANRIGSFLSNTGEFVSYTAAGGNAGMFWPRGTIKTINYASGIWIGGKVEGRIRTAASEFSQEFVGGTYEDWLNRDDPKYRVYEISSSDLRDEPGVDYLEWPFEQGAPHAIDENGEPILDDNGNLMPFLIGEKTYWSVSNERSPVAHSTLFSTPPLGVEVHMLVWGYNRRDEFGDMMFMKFTVINKSDHDIKDAYLSFWADVDLGFANDDLVGSDTLLGLGYNYNQGADNVYEPDAAPAIGYDFFQGPAVSIPCPVGTTVEDCRDLGGTYIDEDEDGVFDIRIDIRADTAKVSRHLRKSGMIIGFKNLGMTSFSWYANGGPPGSGDPNTAFEAYNFMQGFDGLGKVVINQDNGEPTKFFFPGDPVKGTGWVQTDEDDQRFMQSSGPFTLAMGDTQELVGGVIIAQGSSALNSVTKMKAADVSAQVAYDIDFALPASPPPPLVAVGAAPGKIVLTWESNAESYNAIDRVKPNLKTGESSTNYKFQGYNIYQVDGPIDIPSLTRQLLVTYDLVDTLGDIKDFVDIGIDNVEITVQEASNSGITRFLNIEKDALLNTNLVDYRKYYFLVEVYGVNPFGVPKVLQSGTIVTGIPGAPPAGIKLNYDPGEIYGDYFNTNTTPNEGIADIKLNALIVDPNQTKDKTFEISFFTAPNTFIDVLADPPDTIEFTDYMWVMEDITLGEIVLDSQATLKDKGLPKGLLTSPNQIDLYDGMSVTLDATYEPAADIDSAGTRQTVNIDTTTLLNFHGTSVKIQNADIGQLKDFQGLGGDQPKTFRRDVELRITDKGSQAWMYISAVKMAINIDSSKSVQVPFELWDIEYDNGDGTFGRQINAIFVDDWEEEDFLNGFLGALNGEVDIVIPVYSAYSTDSITSADTMAAWMLFFGQDSSIADEPIFSSTGALLGFKKPGYSVGDVYRFSFNNHIEVEEDVIRFMTLAPSLNDSAKTAEISKINVFPNPYFGQNIEEINSFDRFVTFTHLPPDSTTIRIFTLAGHLVKSIQHINGTSMEKWDLTNRSFIPIASGMYIAHIEIEGGASKVLKLAVFIPEERLDLF